MASINDGYRVLFADGTSDEYGVSLASAIASISRSGNSENRNIVVSKNSHQNFNLHGVTYDNPLSLDLIFYNIDGSYFDANKERVMKKWIMKNNYNWLQIDQMDLGNIAYYCIATEISLIDIGTYTGGILCKFQCSAPWAFSELKKKPYSTVNGSLTFNLNLMLDFSDYEILPNLIIKPTSTGTVKIKNNTTNETIELTNCVANETIIIECGSDKISSSSGRLMINSWNKQTISLVENLNNVTLTGNFDLSMEYRLPIRVGA